MNAQDVINVLTIMKGQDSVSFCKIQRTYEMSISTLENVLNGLMRMELVYKSSLSAYSLVESKSVSTISTGVRTALEDIITNRSAHLSESLLSKVSAPFIPMMTHEYRNARTKVMIVGQETLGMEAPLSSISSTRDYIEGQIEYFNNFNFGEELRGSHFWYAFDQVVAHFGLPSRRHAYWTNLNKFQLVSEVGESVSPSKLPIGELTQLIKMQRELFLAEIEDTKPDVIIYFTGNQTWMLDHYLNNGNKLAVKAIDERLHLGIIETEFLYNPIAVCTDHPARRGYTDAIVNHRLNLLKYASEKIGQ